MHNFVAEKAEKVIKILQKCKTFEINGINDKNS
jgi:hypothetical protein